jgi:hypothetical protein
MVKTNISPRNHPVVTIEVMVAPHGRITQQTSQAEPSIK